MDQSTRRQGSTPPKSQQRKKQYYAQDNKTVPAIHAHAVAGFEQQVGDQDLQSCSDTELLGRSGDLLRHLLQLHRFAGKGPGHEPGEHNREEFSILPGCAFSESSKVYMGLIIDLRRLSGTRCFAGSPFRKKHGYTGETLE